MISEFFGIINIIFPLLLLPYVVRQYLFSIVTLRQNEPDNFTDYAPTRTVSILIAARNEEKVLDRTLCYMSKLDYPHDKIEILVLNDASTDRTSEIAHQWANRFTYIHVVDRPKGGMGKGDVMNQGISESKNEIVLVFDADYTPAPDTIKRLVRWFDDPKVGLVQGRIHVVNKDENFLTKIVHAERSAGFLCELQARDKIGLSAQYGGTAGGFRRELISKVGEWEPKVYSEDTDLTCRALLAGYKTKYDVTVDCGEEAPDKLKVYCKQRYRWIRGHTVCGLKYTRKILASSFLSIREKMEGLLWLNINLIPILIVIGLASGVAQLFLSPVNFIPQPYALAFMLLSTVSAIAMVFAGLYQIKQLRYLKFVIPMMIGGYFMSLSVSLKAYFDILSNSPFKWVKTERSGRVT